MKKHVWTAVVLLLCLASIRLAPVSAEVLSSAANGFQIRIEQASPLSARATFDCLTRDLGKWWDADHTYSLDASNLSMDLERRCMLETLPDGGFVRHMEILFSAPGRQLTLSGGLGPLQEMGVAGSLVFRLKETEEGTAIQLTYNVVGFDGQALDKIAPAVDQVLKQQLERLARHCATHQER